MQILLVLSDSMEVWKDIPEYEGRYQISNYGRVKSLPKRRGRGIGYPTDVHILKHSINSRGYCNVVLCKDGRTKTFALHRLVAGCFLDNPTHLPEVDHKDRNKTNNHVENLRWATSSENNLNRQNGFPVTCIETGRVFSSANSAGKELGIHGTSITACCKKKLHHNTCGGYHWKYAEEVASATFFSNGKESA